jgi:hypothetical protein
MRPAACFVVLGAAASVAHANITYLSDSRSLHTHAYAGDGSSGNGDQGTMATNPIFNTSVQSVSNNGGPPWGPGSASATASQHSELLATSITGMGDGSASGHVAAGPYAASASSSLNVTFHLDSAVNFTLTASASATGSPPLDPSLVLFQFDGASIGTYVIHPGGPNINASGVLAAGDYHITAGAHNSDASPGGITTGSFNFSLVTSVPAPASVTPGLAALGLCIRRRRS